MENASQALIIAGTVLLSVLIISLGVYLFNEFGGASKQINDQLTSAQISEFNSQFTKYEGQTTIRAHDIVSIANLARQNNEKYYGKDYNTSVENESYYITVKIPDKNHFENSKESELQEFIKNYSLKNDNTPYYFKCTEVKISDITKLVISITFSSL